MLIAGVAVTDVRDLGTGVDTRQANVRAVLPWSAGDSFITFFLEGATVSLRASGTEPKVKFYVEAVNAEEKAAAVLADKLAASVLEMIS